MGLGSTWGMRKRWFVITLCDRCGHKVSAKLTGLVLSPCTPVRNSSFQSQLPGSAGLVYTTRAGKDPHVWLSSTSHGTVRTFVQTQGFLLGQGVSA